jgi:hypothetical protein
MHRQVSDRDLLRAGAQQGRKLFIDRVEALRSGHAAAGLRAEIEGDDLRALVVSRKQRPVRTKRQRPDRRHRRTLAGHCHRASRRRSPGRHDDERD